MLKINDKIIILIISIIILIFITFVFYYNYKYNIQKIEQFQDNLEDVEDVCEARKKLGLEPCISVAKGDIGKSGDKGDEGIMGPQGPIGPIGLTGADGKNGKSIGPLEYWNEDGTIKLGEYKPADMSHIPVTKIYIPNGNRGQKGEKGVIGPIGPVGESGAPGVPGVCYKGDRGEKGERGDPGGIADDIMINTINKEKDDNGNSKNLEIWGNEFKIKSAKFELEDAKLIMRNDINLMYSDGAQGGGIYWKDAHGDNSASLYYGSANTLNVENDNGININDNIFSNKTEEESEAQDSSIKSKFYNILNGNKFGLNITPYNDKLYIIGDLETTGDIKSKQICFENEEGGNQVCHDKNTIETLEGEINKALVAATAAQNAADKALAAAATAQNAAGKAQTKANQGMSAAEVGDIAKRAAANAVVEARKDTYSVAYIKAGKAMDEAVNARRLADNALPKSAITEAKKSGKGNVGEEIMSWFRSL
mgnify:CR=1 FL=1|jgi:hypothetical protein